MGIAMKRFSFTSFIVDDVNRQANQVCLDVADLKPVGRQPTVLLGDEGCGKTHLLYAIVNRVRATTARTGLAYVTAHDFPAQVRDLIADPTPVQRAESAILLVDQLEQFSNYVDELDSVIRIFLDNRHYVVIASNMHPGRIQHLTVGLRSLLDQGTIVSLGHHGSDTKAELLKRQIRQECDVIINKQRDEIQELRSLLDQGMRPPAPAVADEEIARLTRLVDSERAAKDALAKQLEHAKELNQNLQLDLATVQDELAQAIAQVGAVRNEVLQSVQAETDLLRREVENAKASAKQIERADQEAPVAEAAALREQLLHAQLAAREAEAAVRSVMQAEVDALRQQFHDAQMSAETAQREAARYREQAAAQSASMGDLREVYEQLSASDSARKDLLAQLDTERAKLCELENEKESLGRQLALSQSETEGARRESNDLLARAEKALQTIEANRARLAQAELEQKQQTDELKTLLEQANLNAARAEQFEAAFKDLGETRDTCDRLRQEKEQTDADYSIQIAQLRGQLEESQARAARNEHENQELKQAMEAVKADRELATAALHQLRIESTEQQAELTKAQGRIASFEQAEAAWESQKSDYKTALRHLDAQRADLQSEIERVKGELADAEARMDAAKAQMEQTTREFQATLEASQEAIVTLRFANDKRERIARELIATANRLKETMLTGTDTIVNQAALLESNPSSHQHAPTAPNNAEEHLKTSAALSRMLAEAPCSEEPAVSLEVNADPSPTSSSE